MVNGSPGDRPGWVLRWGLAQDLAPPLDLQPKSKHPQSLAGLMQITHKNQRRNRIYRPNPSEALISSSG